MKRAMKHDSLTATGAAAMKMLRQASLTGFAAATIISPTLSFGSATTAKNTTNFTSSTAEIDTTVNTAVNNQVNTYSTELIARLQGGPTLYDQTFGVAATDTAFLTAVTAAESVLTSDGATSFTGPSLLSSNDTLSTSTSSVQSSVTTVYTSVGDFVGPQTIYVGNFGVCGSYSLNGGGYPVLSGCSNAGSAFTLLSGQTDIDTFVLSFYNVQTTTTTTNTDLLTQVYELDGVVTTQSTVPEPGTLSLLSFGLAGIFLRRRKSPKE